MISGDKIAENIFKILKGNGYDIKIFTDEGETTINSYGRLPNNDV